MGGQLRISGTLLGSEGVYTKQRGLSLYPQATGVTEVPALISLSPGQLP